MIIFPVILIVLFTILYFWIKKRGATIIPEEDTSIPQSGLIGFQIHGGGKAKVAFKDIHLEELE